MPKNRDANQLARDANTTKAFFAGPPAHDSLGKTCTQGCLHVKKALTVSLSSQSSGPVGEAVNGPINALCSESRNMVEKSGERDMKTMFERKLDLCEKQAKHAMKMAECDVFSKMLSLYAQRLDENPELWKVGNPECHSYGMAHLEAIAENFDKDVVHHERDWQNLRHCMAPSTLEARFDRVIQIITKWRHTATFYWMEIREFNIEKRFGFRNERYQPFFLEAYKILGNPPRKEVLTTPLQIWEDPRTYFDPKILLSPKKPAGLMCDPVLETRNGEKLVKHSDKKSDDENDKKANGPNDKNSDGEDDKKTGTKMSKKKSKKARSNGKKKAKKNGKETVEQIDGKIVKKTIEYTQEITDRKDRNKDQTPDASTEATIDHEEGKKNKPKYDALSQCTRVIEKLDELVLHMKLATEEAHAINTSTATTNWPLAETYQGAIGLHGVVVTTWANLPKNIQQDILDMIYFKDEVVNLEPVIRRERDRIRETFMIWCNAGPKVWAFGCAHQLDMPILRSYEYHRTTFLASSQVAMHTDIKVTNFFKSTKGKQYRSPELEAALAHVDLEQEWEECFQDFRDQCKSVDEMMDEITKAGGHWGGVEKIPKEQWFRWVEPIMEVEDADCEKLKAGSGFGKFVFTS